MPGREVEHGQKQISLYFIMLGLGFFVFHPALGSLGSLWPLMFPCPTFTFKCISVTEQKNFCSFLQTSLPAEAALSSASRVLFVGGFSSWLMWGGVLWGFSSSLIPMKQLRTGLRDAAGMESASTADLTAAVRQSGLCALPRDACRLCGLCCLAQEAKDAVNEGNRCYLCPQKGNPGGFFLSRILCSPRGT